MRAAARVQEFVTRFKPKGRAAIHTVVLKVRLTQLAFVRIVIYGG